MLSLPRANYLTSAAAGLPLMLVSYAVGFTHGVNLHCRLLPFVFSHSLGNAS